MPTKDSQKNVIDIKLNNVKYRIFKDTASEFRRPWFSLFKTQSSFLDYKINQNLYLVDQDSLLLPNPGIKIKRELTIILYLNNYQINLIYASWSF